MKYLCFILIFFTITEVVNAQTPKGNYKDSLLNVLKAKKTGIDKYVASHSKAALLYAKVPGKRHPVEVRMEMWPENITCSYNVLKDTAGRIIMIAEIPFSESGDWFISYTHYFDINGNTYAFTKNTKYFDDDVKGGVISESLIKYYRVNFTLVTKSYRIRDINGVPIKNNGHIEVYDFKYTIYKNVNDCLAAYNINTTR